MCITKSSLSGCHISFEICISGPDNIAVFFAISQVSEKKENWIFYNNHPEPSIENSFDYGDSGYELFSILSQFILF